MTEAEAVSFELERFELASDERLEVSGRWFGVRGRRFVRPTLLVLADGRECRSLAVLEHKPWDALDGEPWVAVFPWQRDPEDLVDAELAVAPDIAVALPAPTHGRRAGGRRGAGAARRRSSRSPQRISARRGRDGRPVTQKSSRPSTAANSRDESRSPDRDALERALEQERAQTLRLRRELERADTARIEGASAIARRNAALARLDGVTAERDAAVCARDEATAEREALAHDRDRLRSELDRALSSREAELEQRRAAIEASVAERIAALGAELERERSGATRMARTLRQRDTISRAAESALRERDAARAECDAVRRELNNVLAQRDSARADSAENVRQWEFAAARGTRRTQERDAALVERDRLIRERDAAVTERDRLVEERDEGIVRHDGPMEERGRLPRRSAPRREPTWLPRALAALALLVFVGVFLVLWFSA